MVVLGVFLRLLQHLLQVVPTVQTRNLNLELTVAVLPVLRELLVVVLLVLRDLLVVVAH